MIDVYLTKSHTTRFKSLLEPPAGVWFFDYFYLFALFIFFYWNFELRELPLARMQMTRHIPLAVTIPILALCIIGRLMHPQRRPRVLPARMSDLWPFSLFGLFVFVGSIYARMFNGVEETFITMGLFLFLGLHASYWLITTALNPEQLIKRISAVYIVSATIALVFQLVGSHGTHVYHSQEHLVVTAMGYWLIAARSGRSMLFGTLLMVLSAVALNKLTGYIVCLIIGLFAYLEWLDARTLQISDRVKADIIKLLAWAACLVGSTLVYGVYLFVRSNLPDGNTVYRMHTYEKAWDKFLDSPLWGSAFTQPSVEKFELFQVASTTQRLPTHSDPLDILAHGGLTAALLLSFGLGPLIWKAFSSLRDRSKWCNHDTLRAHCKLHFLIVISGISVFAFNPVLNTAANAQLYWTSVGVLAASLKLIAATTPHNQG